MKRSSRDVTERALVRAFHLIRTHGRRRSYKKAWGRYLSQLRKERDGRNGPTG